MTTKDYFSRAFVTAVLLASAVGTSAVTPMARLAPPGPAQAAQDDARYETIMYEDFSKWSAGTPESPDETMYPENYFTDYDNTLPSDMFNNEGDYNGVGCYQAGGCLALNYPGQGGYINFPATNMLGKLVLTSRVKAVGETPTMFAMCIVTGDPASPQSVENDNGMNGMMRISSADGWVDIRREIINPYADDCWLQINAMMYNTTGIVVDYVKIERDCSFLTPPAAGFASHFTNDGFTAEWQADPAADSYLVSLYEKVPISSADNMANEDFESAVLDEMSGEIALKNGWKGKFGFSLDGNIVTAAEAPDDVFEGNQSLRLYNNDRLTLFLDNTLVKDMTMALYANVEDKDNSTAELRVIPYTKYNPGDDDYGFYWMILPKRLDSGWNWVQLSERFDDFMGGYTRLDLEVKGLKEGESMVLDNICAVTESLAETKCVIEDEVTDEASYTFTGLDMNNTYYFTVKARNENSVSEPSEQVYAFGVGAPIVKEVTDLDKRGAFTANWEPAANATSYTLNCYEGVLLKDSYPDYPVFTEDFSGAVGGEDGNFVFLNNVDFVELDSFADNDGWGGSGTIIGDGMVGCYEMEAYGQKLPFEMLSPAMNLSHDDGKFKVTVDFVIQNEGEMLVIQCDNTSYIAISGAEPGKPASATVELTGGTDSSKLMFYALNSTPFALDKVEVTQNYTSGDELLTKVDFREVADGSASSGRISGLERKDGITYLYELVSHRAHYGMVYNSEPSEKVRVDLYGVNSLESIELDGNGEYQIFDLNGRQIQSEPAPGIYIVVKEGKVYKTVVK